MPSSLECLVAELKELWSCRPDGLLLVLERTLEGYHAVAVKVYHALFLDTVSIKIAFVAINPLDAGVDGILDLAWVPQDLPYPEGRHALAHVFPCVRIGPRTGSQGFVPF